MQHGTGVWYSVKDQSIRQGEWINGKGEKVSVSDGTCTFSGKGNGYEIRSDGTKLVMNRWTLTSISPDTLRFSLGDQAIFWYRGC